jgi:hypothetical protein
MWPADSRGIRKRWRGHADSLGERLVVETALGVRVEALALAPGLIASERAGQVLRRQVHHLADISHPALRPPRDVVRLSPADDRLAVVSDYVPGQRASRWLQAGGPRRLPTSTVLFIAREVASALATATEHVPGSFHGTLGLERIVLTPDKRVMVVEPGLGPALALLPRAFSCSSCSWADCSSPRSTRTGSPSCWAKRRKQISSVAAPCSGLACSTGSPRPSAWTVRRNLRGWDISSCGSSRSSRTRADTWRSRSSWT